MVVLNEPKSKLKKLLSEDAARTELVTELFKSENNPVHTNESQPKSIQLILQRMGYLQEVKNSTC